MKKWLKTTLAVILGIAALIGALAAHIYFQVDNRISAIETVDSQTAPSNGTIIRLDSTVLTADSVTNYLNKLTAEHHITGLAISIINNGEVTYQHYFGQRNGIKSQPFTASTIFYGASFSKTMLADISLQLAEEGKLQLDSPLYLYLPKPLPEFRTNLIQQFFGANYYDYADLAGDSLYKKITARMCLTHTTGLPNWRWIEPDGKLKFKFQPGQRYSYSGEGMFLLQLVLEKITGKGFEALAVEKIFEPMHLSQSSFVWQRGFEGNYAIGHGATGNFLGIPKTNVPNAAGSLSTTLEDFTKYFTAVLSQKEARYQLMTTRQITIRFKRQFGPEANVETHENDSIHLGYGLGFGVYETPFGRAFFKEGHGDGWQHYAVAFPDRKTGLVIMSNSDNAEGVFKKLIEFTLANPYTPWYWEGYDPK